jgi:chromosome segregation ATPase
MTWLKRTREFKIRRVLPYIFHELILAAMYISRGLESDVQVLKLQQEVKRIRTQSTRKSKQKQENRNVLAQVDNLQSELNAAQGGQEEMKMKVHAMETKLEEAANREAKLNTDLHFAREQIESMQMEAQRQESKVLTS